VITPKRRDSTRMQTGFNKLCKTLVVLRLGHRNANPGASDKDDQKANRNERIPCEILLLLHDDSNQK
jgi:hypothetical protein